MLVAEMMEVSTSDWAPPWARARPAAPTKKCNLRVWPPAGAPSAPALIALQSGGARLKIIVAAPWRSTTNWTEFRRARGTSGKGIKLWERAPRTFSLCSAVGNSGSTLRLMEEILHHLVPLHLSYAFWHSPPPLESQCCSLVWVVQDFFHLGSGSCVEESKKSMLRLRWLWGRVYLYWCKISSINSSISCL